MLVELPIVLSETLLVIVVSLGSISVDISSKSAPSDTNVAIKALLLAIDSDISELFQENYPHYIEYDLLLHNLYHLSIH